MILAVTPIYAAILAVLMLILANLVSAARSKANVSIMHGDNMDLALAIRRHGNFTENVPFALLLIAFAELLGMPSVWLHVAGVALVISRLLHLRGLDVNKVAEPFRISGGLGTQLVVLGCAGFLLWQTFL